MKICSKCNAELDDDAKFCVKCGTKIEDNSKLLVVIVVVFILLVVGIITAVVLSKNNNQEEPIVYEQTDTEITTEEKQTEKAMVGTTEADTTEDVAGFQSYELVDYYILYRLINGMSGELYGADLLDTDSDGIQELYISVGIRDGDDFIHPQPTNICIEPYTEPYIYIYTDFSASGYAGFLVDYNEYKVYLNKNYSTAGAGYNNYSVWEQSKWKEFGTFNYSLDENSERQYSYSWNGNEISQKEWDELESTLLNSVTELKDNSSYIENFHIEGQTLEQTATDFEEHLSILNEDYERYDIDYDNDGTVDVVFSVTDYVQPWVKRLESFNELENEPFVSESMYEPSMLVIMKEDSDGIHFYLDGIGSLLWLDLDGSQRSGMEELTDEELRIATEDIKTLDKMFGTKSKYFGMTFEALLEVAELDLDNEYKGSDGEKHTIYYIAGNDNLSNYRYVDIPKDSGVCKTGYYCDEKYSSLIVSYYTDKWGNPDKETEGNGVVERGVETEETYCDNTHDRRKRISCCKSRGYLFFKINYKNNRREVL